MREIQCSNVSVLLKNRAILCIRAMLNALGKWRNDCEQYPVWGGHRACNLWTGIRGVRVATHLQACLELRSDLGIYGVSLKLFGPFPLAPGLMKHVLVSSSGGPGPVCGPTPRGGPRRKGLRPLPGPLGRARG